MLEIDVSCTLVYTKCSFFLKIYCDVRMNKRMKEWMIERTAKSAVGAPVYYGDKEAENE